MRGRRATGSYPAGILGGVLLYVCALVLFASMDASTKTLVRGAFGNTTLPVIEVMWARFAFHLVAVAVAIKASGRRLPLVARAPGLQALRSAALAGSTLFFALALRSVPLAEAAAFNYSGPIITVALAAVWLHETVGVRRWVGVAVGMVGGLVVLRPATGAFHPGDLFALATAFSFAVYQVLTRRLAGVDAPATTIFQTGLWATLGCSLAVPFVWVPPDLFGWAILILLGVIGGGSHYLLVLAYERAPASVLAPLAFSGLVWSVLFGILLFGEIPDGPTVAGGLVIVLGGLVVVTARPPRSRSNVVVPPAQVKPKAA